MAKKSDLTGKKFGHLTVLERTEQTQDRYAVWRCKCDCGGEILVNTKRLVRGTIDNCGCIPKTTARRGPVAEDLTGRQFGDLTVLYRDKNNSGGRTRWVCRCKCGKIHSASAQELKNGKTKSCGCRRHTPGRCVKDITGQVFGRLTALYPTDKRDQKSSVFWHCRCECGNELDVTEDNLVHGNYKSCGCLRLENQKNIPNQLHLVDGTCVELLEKRKERSDNTSGFRGVYPAPNGRYRVSIGFKGHRYHVGIYRNFSEAVQARLSAEQLIHDGFVKAYYVWKNKAEQDEQWAEENPLVYDVEKVNGDFRVITNMDIE